MMSCVTQDISQRHRQTAPVLRSLPRSRDHLSIVCVSHDAVPAGLPQSLRHSPSQGTPDLCDQLQGSHVQHLIARQADTLCREVRAIDNFQRGAIDDEDRTRTGLEGCSKQQQLRHAVRRWRFFVSHDGIERQQRGQQRR